MYLRVQEHNMRNMKFAVAYNTAHRWAEIMVSLFLLVDSAASSSPTTLVTLTHCPLSLPPPLQSNLPNGFLLRVKTEVASHNPPAAIINTRGLTDRQVDRQ